MKKIFECITGIDFEGNKKPGNYLPGLSYKNHFVFTLQLAALFAAIPTHFL